MRKEDGAAAGLRRKTAKNVLPEGVVGAPLRWRAVKVATPWIRGKDIAIPLLDGIGWIGQRDVETHQAVTLHKLRVREGITALDIKILNAVKEAIHSRNRRGHQVALLPEETYVAPLLSPAAQMGYAGQQHAAGTASRIVDGLT